nr:hypothetical protein [Bacteroidota bacterium]
MKKLISLFVVHFLLSSILFSQEWIPFTKPTPESPIIDLIDSDNERVEFYVEVCGMHKTELMEEGESF